VAILLVEQNVPLTLEASHGLHHGEGTVRPTPRLRAQVNDAVIHQYLGV